MGVSLTASSHTRLRVHIVSSPQMLPRVVHIVSHSPLPRLFNCCINAMAFTPPGVDVHAEDRLADEPKLYEDAEDDTAEAEVQEPLEERRARQHGLRERCGQSAAAQPARCGVAKNKRDESAKNGTCKFYPEGLMSGEYG